jgi:hypothetical protein
MHDAIQWLHLLALGSLGLASFRATTSLRAAGFA